MPICKVCGKKFKSITWSHLKKHKMTINDYKKKYPDAKIESEQLKNSHPSGTDHWLFGKHHTEESNRKNRLAHLGKRPSKKTKEAISDALKGKKKSKEHARHISESKKGIHTSPDTEFKRGHEVTKEMRKKLSESHKKKIRNDPQYAKKLMDRLSLASRHPNKAEGRLLEFLKSKDPDWEYVGNNKLLIDGKCPDFVDNKGNIIELFGEYWHDPEEEKERINFFLDRGYNCIVIWDYELNELNEIWGGVTLTIQNI